jgi:NADH:ubiquinone oxidoreductase subunit 6 (subunit J)
MTQTSPIVFYLLAAYVLASGLGVVRQYNLFHAGISLISCFLGVAGIYITLGAPFLAGMQVLIYAGAISVVLLFAFMLTHDLMHSKAQFFQPAPGLTTSLVLGAVLIATTWNSPWLQGNPGAVAANDVRALGLSYMTTYFMPFQLVALLLLISLMGAVVIARKEEGPRSDANDKPGDAL